MQWRGIPKEHAIHNLTGLKIHVPHRHVQGDGAGPPERDNNVSKSGEVFTNIINYKSSGRVSKGIFDIRGCKHYGVRGVQGGQSAENVDHLLCTTREHGAKLLRYEGTYCVIFLGVQNNPSGQLKGCLKESDGTYPTTGLS